MLEAWVKALRAWLVTSGVVGAAGANYYSCYGDDAAADDEFCAHDDVISAIDFCCSATSWFMIT